MNTVIQRHRQTRKTYTQTCINTETHYKKNRDTHGRNTQIQSTQSQSHTDIDKHTDTRRHKKNMMAQTPAAMHRHNNALRDKVQNI